MKDIVDEMAATDRGVQRRFDDGTEVVVVSLRRSYAAEVADVWDAVVDPERLRRSFLPVSGDLRLGGAFQLEVRGVVVEDPAAWESTLEVQRYSERTIAAWAEVAAADGAPADDVAAAVQMARAQFTPDLVGDDGR